MTGSLEVTVNRELLRYAVQRAIFCPYSKVVLDVATAVYVEVKSEQGVVASSAVLHGEVWDRIGAQAVAKLAEAGAGTVEVIDGRVVFA